MVWNAASCASNAYSKNLWLLGVLRRLFGEESKIAKDPERLSRGGRVEPTDCSCEPGGLTRAARLLVRGLQLPSVSDTVFCAW